MIHMDPRSEEMPTSQLHRALDIVESLARTGRPQSFGEISSTVAAPKATTHRLLATLVARGYATQDARSGQYTAGIRCFELGSLWAQNLDLRALAAPWLAELNDATLETVHLAIYDQGDIVYIEKLESPQPVVAKSFVGRRCPAFCVATGRALLAHQITEEIERALAEPLPRFTDATVVDPLGLDALLADVRAHGVAVNHGCFREGVGGVAVPVRDHTGAAVAAVGLCLPEHRFGPDRFDLLRDATFAAAQAISERLGFPGRLVGAAEPASVGAGPAPKRSRRR
jgi:DNA-binding IclR family transcriptional regulator